MAREQMVTEPAGSSEVYWFVRKAGWVQGPLRLESLRHMYASGWVHALDLVAKTVSGPWCEARECPDLQGHVDASADPAGGSETVLTDWEFASATVACTAPVTFAMLQMLAAAGRLRPSDLVRHVPDGDWGPARSVGGIFGGQRAWCAACGRALEGDGARCECGAPQPEYEASLANVALVCGGLSGALFSIVVVLVTWLGWRGAVVLDVAILEKFPQVFAVTLVPVAFLATMAVVLGRTTLHAMRVGRVAPGDRSAASLGLWMGVATWIMVLLATVAIGFFSLAYFSW